MWQSRKRTEKSKKDKMTSRREEGQWIAILQLGKEMTDGRYARVFNS